MDEIFADEMPRSRVAVLLKQFSQLADDREPWRIAYPLAEVVLLLTCATIAGCDDFDDIVAWGEHQGCSTLREVFDLAEGFDASERGGVSILGDGVRLIEAEDIVGEAA